MDGSATVRQQSSMVLSKLDNLVKQMHDPQTGVHAVVKNTMKNINSSPNITPCTFTGGDLIDWLIWRLRIEDGSAEAIHIGSMLINQGYIYPINDSKHVTGLKDDGTLYRFQTPYYWPSVNWRPDDVEYAIYLNKRCLRSNKLKHGLDSSEQAALIRLQKVLCDKWEFVNQQAQAQIKLLKQHNKSDRALITSQEKAFWRLQRQAGPDHVNAVEKGKGTIANSYVYPSKRTIENYRKEIERLQSCFQQPRIRLCKVCENIISRCELYKEHDPLITTPRPSNPWISSDTTMWELPSSHADGLTERQVKKWSFCLEELLRDHAGLREFELFLEKEYSSENIKFWLAVQRLKALPGSKVAEYAHEIYRQFLERGASSEINIDSKTMTETVKLLSTPTRSMYDAAQTHIFLLMKKDSYPRFIKSDSYHALLANAYVPTSKKKFYVFGSKKRSPHPSPSRSRRRGSVTGNDATEYIRSDHRGRGGTRGEGGGGGAEDRLSTSSLSQHSYSTGNLKDIDSDQSSNMSAFGSTGNVQAEYIHRSSHRLSPASLKKKLKDLMHIRSRPSSPNRGADTLEVPPPPHGISNISTVNGSQHNTFANSSLTSSRAGGDVGAFSCDGDIGSYTGSSYNFKNATNSNNLMISVPSPTTRTSNVIAPWEDEIYNN